MGKLRVGVIGLGSFGEKHVQALKAIPYVELVAVCSRREQRAREVASQHHIAKYYTNYLELVEDPRIEAVTIATGDAEHKDPTIAAAKAGKHILVEKPIAATLKDADEMIAAARRYSIIFMVGHILRFDPRYAMVRELAERELGEIKSLYARRNATLSTGKRRMPQVPPVLGAGIHDIDIARWYIGSEASRLYAEKVDTLGLKYPNIMWTTIRFRNGSIAVFENAYTLPDASPYIIDGQLEVLGTRGSAYIGTAHQGLAVCVKGEWKYPDTYFWPTIQGELRGALTEEMAYFTRCVLDGREPTIVTPEDAREALRLALAAYESAVKKAVIEF
jgi:UDP-N-acetylglucosamine 3-dehydrogenase